MHSSKAYAPEFEGGIKRRVLLFPKCQSCGKFHWYPMPRCPYCRSEAIEWTPSSGLGSIFTCTRVEHAFDSAWKSAVPYSVALVEFADAPGIRLVALLVANPPLETAIGSLVKPVFDLSGECPRVLFEVVLPARPEERLSIPA